MKQTTVLIGGQWGDEGKGKIVDVLTENADWIVRYQGGNNAGHTVEIGDKKFVLHLVPSGMLREGKRCVLGNGVVLDPAGLVKEINGLRAKGIEPQGRLFISERAHLVMPWHKENDTGRETASEGIKIGTTRRGIGPAYADKANRIGLRAGEMLRPDFAERVRTAAALHARALEVLGRPALDVDAIVTEYLGYASALAPFVADTARMLNSALARSEVMLFEGAQGTMLDIDHGTYPFVTSSNATSGGATTGTGVPPNRIKEVVGVVKAYTTRVGEGPFPSELLDADGEKMGRIGAEFGATTGRARRCGWFDAVVARHAVMINGVDWWALTKMDVLDHFETLRICTAYELDGNRIDYVPSNIEDFGRCVPVYEEMPGWMCATGECASFEALPERAREYVHRLEVLTGVPAHIVSVGPKRHSTLFRGPLSAPVPAET